MTLDRPHRVFLLSPAKASGLRAQLITSERGKSEMAVRVREKGAPLGEIFTFVSGLYFRGKMAYAERFAAPPPGAPGSLIITPACGLVPPVTVVSLEELRFIGSVNIDASEERYCGPLKQHAHMLRDAVGPDCGIILLGSIATAKYVDPLLDIFGDRLLFPSEFVGRGDMSRGGLMLRCSRSGEELTYVPVKGAVRHGKRPPRLPKLRRSNDA